MDTHKHTPSCTLLIPLVCLWSGDLWLRADLLHTHTAVNERREPSWLCVCVCVCVCAQSAINYQNCAVYTTQWSQIKDYSLYWLAENLLWFYPFSISSCLSQHLYFLPITPIPTMSSLLYLYRSLSLSLTLSLSLSLSLSTLPTFPLPLWLNILSRTGLVTVEQDTQSVAMDLPQYWISKVDVYR